MTEMMLHDPRVARAIQVVWHEAQLLDDKEYEAWEKLYGTDAMYVVPIDHTTDDFANSLNMVYDDARMRRMRVDRMVQGNAPSAVAAARTVRTVSSFRATDVSDTHVTLTSAQVLVSYKRSATDVLGARVTHRISLDDGGDRIELKVIRLLNSDQPVHAAGFLL
ncbi:aromatic-ring-hydroxylating dioxygenase subunit beta [Janibacter sp. GS2]|uniref:aromatic-ring-hydroxylating dioxygenase subunit beta n=1 Tax=Janibacter sp. GS2 TaxID=3442646 RepID=UPI003EBCC0A8